MYENDPVGMIVTQIMSTDADVIETTATYSIQAGNGAGKFSIDSSSGVIRVANTLDFETTASYTLTIRAADAGTPANTNTLSLVITVVDINEHTPVYSPSDYSTKFVFETVSLNSVMYSTTATDGDSVNSGNGNLTFSVIADDADGRLAINSTTGVIYVAKSLCNLDTYTISMTVRVRDQPPASVSTCEQRCSNYVASFSGKDLSSCTTACALQAATLSACTDTCATATESSSCNSGCSFFDGYARTASVTVSVLVVDRNLATPAFTSGGFVRRIHRAGQRRAGC
jgi:hypothetical protein